MQIQTVTIIFNENFYFSDTLKETNDPLLLRVRFGTRG